MKNDGIGTFAGGFGRAQSPEHRHYTRGSVVPGALKPLFSVGRGLPETEGDHLGSEYDVGVAMDRGECDEISGVEDTNGGIDIRYRL